MTYAIGLGVFAVTQWLGLFLLARSSRRPAVAWAAAGTLAYALVLWAQVLVTAAPEPWSAWIGFGAVLPIGCWTVAIAISLSPRAGLRRHPGRLALVLLATLFLALGLGLWLWPALPVPAVWAWFLIGCDVLVLGWLIAVQDALDLGETAGPVVLRSFIAAALAVVLLTGPLVWLWLEPGRPQAANLIALALVTTLVVAGQVFGDRWQDLVDRLAFRAAPQLRQARQDLRDISSALPRIDGDLDPATLPREEFVRLTRRALGSVGNLTRLVGSPLTRLTDVTRRIEARGAHNDALERAQELRALLLESIERLKPKGSERFGTGEEWRYYNALYYPYVVGLKPFSLRAEHADLDPMASQALAWFRSTIPERTLHNWQNAAARLIADQLGAAPSASD